MTSMRKHAAPIIAAILLLLPVLYVGSYLSLVTPGYKTIQQINSHYSSDTGETVELVEPERIDETYQKYRIERPWIAKVFWPLQMIDRQVRPDSWGPKELAGPERRVRYDVDH
jgi:hypothetical protein